MDLIRNTPSAMLTAMNGPFFPVLFAFIDWPGAPVYAHSSVGPITWGGEEWSGLGPVGNVEIPTESIGGVVSAEAVLSLVGVPADLDGMADDAIRGRAVELYLGVLQGRPGGFDGQQTSGPWNTLVSDPVSMFAGTMDGLSLDAAFASGVVDHTARVTVTTGPSARSSAGIYHSYENQRRYFPSDTAGRLVILSYAKAQRLTWPAT